MILIGSKITDKNPKTRIFQFVMLFFVYINGLFGVCMK